MTFKSKRVAQAIAAVREGEGYERAPSRDATYLYRLRAAHGCGVYEPFEADAAELNAWLDQTQAGKSLATDAWAAFAKAKPES